MSAHRLTTVGPPGGGRSSLNVLLAGQPVSASWSIRRKANVVEISYGCGLDFPQYAALHTESSFLRLNHGPSCGWGTSIILLPSFWTAGNYHQGAPINVRWQNHGVDLVILFRGQIAGRHVEGQVRMMPPLQHMISASVSVSVFGDVSLDRRPCEAFKPVVLSSMHISENDWDACTAVVETQSFPIPNHGWIVQSPEAGRMFALSAGNSRWKINAPSVEIQMNESHEITGWKTQSFNPNDDNVSLWAATDHVLPFWKYTVTAKL